MAKTNPLVKKGIPTFPVNKEPEQITPENEVIKVKEGQTLSQAIGEFYQAKRKPEKKQVSIYLDTDVIEAFNEFGKAEGKGAKSDLVNNFLRKVLLGEQ
jgi:uncharacterized protein (DUF4415 family)